jgi:hypothetical protein
MNTIHNNGSEDKKLEKDLQELGQAYQQHVAEEPPELLDQAILNKAHRAVETKTGWLDFGWIHAVTTAAVLVLSFSIIISLQQPVPFEENGQPRSQPVSEQGSVADVPDRPAVQESVKKERQQADHAEKAKELRKNVSRDSSSENVPGSEADATAAPVTGMAVSSEAERVAEPSPRDDLRARKVSQPSSSKLEETIAQPAIATFADESTVAEIDADEFKTDKLQTLSKEELLLQSIVALKQAGDDKWRTELEVFKDLFPDYPLPDELKE